MRAKAYPKYKPSGVEWFGDVPDHWVPLALRRISTRYSGGTPDRSNDSYWEDGTIPWINSGAVNQSLIKDPSAFITEEAYHNSSAKWVNKGSLVMALAGQGKTKGMVAQTGIATTCNQSMAAICPTSHTNARYLYWLLISQYEHIRNMAGGEQRDGLNLEILGSIHTLDFPLEEQCVIASFLDRETGRIDTLIAKKRELVDRLKEKRTALISHTVTRGLNPSAPLKPSGIDWLGDIPVHWEAMMLKRTWSVCEYGVSESLSGEGSIRVLTMGNIQDGRVLIPSEGCLDGVPDEMLLEDGDLLFNRTNSLAHVGKVGIFRPHSDASVTFASYLVRLKTNNRTTPEFMNYLLNTSQVLEISRSLALPSINQANLNPTRYGRILIPLPPLPEQIVIAAYLDKETAKLDALVSKVEEAVERLQEYRTALITAAVTGKIDVRKVIKG
jgi:type I restriction enzyme S subunit